MDGEYMNLPYPKAFLDRMESQLGDEFLDFIRAMNESALHGIRFNPLKPCTENSRWMYGNRVPWEENGWYISADEKPGITIWHEAGAFYLQDPAAMLPVKVLMPQPGERILDLCSAPGGKATQIGCAMHGKGLLVCNEIVPKRAVILSRNIERLGIRNSIVTSARPEILAARWKNGFDAVLIDAPCSGEGMFRRDPDTRNEWSPEQAAGCADRQRDILEAGSQMVRPGGRLVYSTCTFNPDENENIIHWFLKQHQDWETEPFRLPETDGSSGMFTCYPHRTKGEGQFAALLRRKGSGISRTIPDNSLPKARTEDARRLSDSLPDLAEATHMFGRTLVHTEEIPDLKGLSVYRIGLHLAELHDKYIVPDHAAAYIAAGSCQTTETDPDTALRYLAGETIPGEETGWTVVTCRGMALGWGKGTCGTIKNHYPKGLRNGLLMP